MVEVDVWVALVVEVGVAMEVVDWSILYVEVGEGGGFLKRFRLFCRSIASFSARVGALAGAGSADGLGAGGLFAVGLGLVVGGVVDIPKSLMPFANAAAIASFIVFIGLVVGVQEPDCVDEF